MQVLRQLKISRNVFPFLCKDSNMNKKDLTLFIIDKLIGENLMSEEDSAVFTMGSTMGKKGSTNTVEIFEVKYLLGN